MFLREYDIVGEFVSEFNFHTVLFCELIDQVQFAFAGYVDDVRGYEIDPEALTFEPPHSVQI